MSHLLVPYMFSCDFGRMHPPMFRSNQRLEEWPECFLDLKCSGCGWSKGASVKLLRRQFGNPTFGDLVPRLRCSHCNARYAPVYLCAGHHHTFCYGGPPDWAVELVPPPRPVSPLLFPATDRKV